MNQSRLRKTQAASKRRRHLVWGGVLVLVVITVALALTGRLAQDRPVLSGKPPLAVVVTSTPASRASSATSVSDQTRAFVSAQDGSIRLSATQTGDQARFYAFAGSDGKTISFFVLRSSDGVIRAAFDACDVCYPAHKGYSQDDDEMVCNNCGSRFSSVRINDVSGGCNPAPLERSVQGDEVIIQAAALEAGSRYF